MPSCQPESRVCIGPFLLLALLVGACGQGDERASTPTTTSAPVAAPTTPPTTQAPAPGAAAPYTFSQAELRELVGPVALYPDVVLASLLPATTFPDQVTDAAEWLGTQGGQVDAPPDDRGWDGSVAALLQFPDVLTWLDENREWEEQMGVAVAYQQSDVLAEIQRFRLETAKAGNLQSNQYQTVTIEEPSPALADAPADEPAPTPNVRIEPAQPETVYVPQYVPTQVTQPAPVQSTVSPWVSFGTGMLVGGLGAWAMYSIFDDDDWDDDDWHGGHGGGHNTKINIHDNVVYGGGGQRPGWGQGANRPGQWQPRPQPLPARPGGWSPARPTPYRPSTRPAERPGYAGVRPPSRLGSSGRPPSPVASTRPAKPGRPGTKPGTGSKPSRPPQVAKTTKAPGLTREPAGVAKASGNRGKASMKGQKPTPAPRPAARPSKPEPQQKQARQSQPKARQQAPAMQRKPTQATRQASSRGNQSLGGGGGGGRGGGGGGRGGGGRGGGGGGGRR